MDLWNYLEILMIRDNFSELKLQSCQMQQKRKVSFVDDCNNGETEQTAEESIQVNVRLIL